MAIPATAGAMIVTGNSKRLVRITREDFVIVHLILRTERLQRLVLEAEVPFLRHCPRSNAVTSRLSPYLTISTRHLVDGRRTVLSPCRGLACGGFATFWYHPPVTFRPFSASPRGKRFFKPLRSFVMILCQPSWH